MSGNFAEGEATGELTPTELLCIPHRKRLSHAYQINRDGARELRLDYGVKEIIFDEERMFAFGEELVRAPSFTGAIATTWGPGYTWDELQPMFEALIEEGIVQRGELPDNPRGGGLVPSQVPKSVCPMHRQWSLAECEELTREVGGRGVEIGYLEAVLPIFRVAHAALDADDRQVGEANVFPGWLRLDRETEWRTCQYSGTRYRDDRPMNVTALRAMIKHWKPMMATLLAIQAELRSREPTRTAWTIGELHTMACVVLGVPAYVLQKGGGATPQVPLHPVLSSLFRITDGIRMTTHQMMFSVEKQHACEEPLDAAGLYQHVEHNGTFIGDHGVCAGPKPMVDEFLATAVDGIPSEGITEVELPAEVQAVVDELPAAVDYALYGLQTWGITFELWSAQARCYAAVLEVFDAHRNTADAGCHARLRARLRRDHDILRRMQVDRDLNRGVHHKGYRAAYESAQRLLRAPAGPPTFAQALAPRPEGAMHVAAAAQLRRLLAERLALDELAPGALDRLVAALVLYVREEQAVLATTAAIQETINTLLARPQPARPLRTRDIHVSFAIGSRRADSYPYLFTLLEQELGIALSCTANTVEVSAQPIMPAQSAPADRPAHSAQV